MSKPSLLHPGMTDVGVFKINNRSVRSEAMVRNNTVKEDHGTIYDHFASFREVAGKSHASGLDSDVLARGCV